MSPFPVVDFRGRERTCVAQVHRQVGPISSGGSARSGAPDRETSVPKGSGCLSSAPFAPELATCHGAAADACAC